MRQHAEKRRERAFESCPGHHYFPALSFFCLTRLVRVGPVNDFGLVQEPSEGRFGLLLRHLMRVPAKSGVGRRMTQRVLEPYHRLPGSERQARERVP